MLPIVGTSVLLSPHAMVESRRRGDRRSGLIGGIVVGRVVEVVTAGGAEDAFVRACMAQGEGERERLQVEVDAGAARVLQLSDELRAASRSLHGARRGLEALKETLARERASFRSDFDQLAALPHVASIDVDGSRVRVRTDAIIVRHGGARYRIGEFALELDLEHGVRMVNLQNTGEKPGWDHPHVQGQRPCLGNLRIGIDKLLAECQLVPLTAMLVQFLETYNPESAYCPIERWERVDA
jgi:hypothetical protein